MAEGFQGLLGSMTPDDRMLALMGIGAGLLSGTGRTRQEAFGNAIQGGIGAGAGLLQPIMANRQAQQKAMTEAEKLKMEKELQAQHAALYGAQTKKVEAEIAQQAAEQAYLERMAGGAGGMPVSTPPSGGLLGPQRISAPGGIGDGAEGSGLTAMIPGQAPSAPSTTMPQGPGGLNYTPADLVRMANSKIAPHLLEVWKASQPKIGVHGGVAVNETEIGRRLANGQPWMDLPQTIAGPTGGVTRLEPLPGGGVHVPLVQGALENQARQAAAVKSAELPYNIAEARGKAKAGLEFSPPMTLPGYVDDEGKLRPLLPYEFTQGQRGGAPRQPLGGLPSPQVPFTPGLKPEPGSPEYKAFEAVRGAQGAVRALPTETGGAQVVPSLPPGVMANPGANPTTMEGRKAGTDEFIRKELPTVNDQAEAARNHNAEIASMRNLSIFNKTGWGTEGKAYGSSILAALGVKDAEKYAASAETFQAHVMSNMWRGLNLAKGPQTEGDAKRFQATAQSLKGQPQFNAFISDFMEAANNRKIAQGEFYNSNYDKYLQKGDVSQVARDWRSTDTYKGSVWDDPALAKWKAGATSTGGSVEDLIKKYRSR